MISKQLKGKEKSKKENRWASDPFNLVTGVNAMNFDVRSIIINTN
jgi:hypothetical protein